MTFLSNIGEPGTHLLAAQRFNIFRGKNSNQCTTSNKASIYLSNKAVNETLENKPICTKKRFKKVLVNVQYEKSIANLLIIVKLKLAKLSHN